MMDGRPKPGEDEDDLLRMQREFLASQGDANNRPSASLKKPDKRKSAEESAQLEGRDVVKMEGIELVGTSSTFPSTIPAKKSKFRSKEPEKGAESSPRTNNTRWPGPRGDAEGNEDIEEMMDRHDTGLAAVLTTIIERDTRNEMYAAPVLGKQAFPSVSHLDFKPGASSTSASTYPKKPRQKSLFAQQVEAQGTEKFGVERIPQAHSSQNRQSFTMGQRKEPQAFPVKSFVVDGRGLSISNSKTESEKIHQENLDKLSKMSEDEILEEQRKLLEMIDPKLVEFLKKKKETKEKEQLSPAKTSEEPKQVSFSVQREMKKKEKQATSTTTNTTDEAMDEDLPIKPKKDWLHMSTVERDKLEWMKDLPPPSSKASETGQPARFDFQGNVMAVDADVPVNVGLHHHGEEPERAGYTLEEIFQLARSSNLQQRTLALHTLAKIIEKAKSGALLTKIETPIIPAILGGGVVMLLRWALDDNIEGAVAAAMDALHALIWNTEDEVGKDQVWCWFQGDISPWMTPVQTLEKQSLPEELDEENKEEETDADVVKRDVVQALVQRMELLTRFRYILDTVRPQAVTVIHILDVLTRLVQHSAQMAYEVVKCPGLLDKIVAEFLPTAWTHQAHNAPVSCVYGLPVPAALRLVRHLCQSGRNLASTLASQYQLHLRILRYITVNSSDLGLPNTVAAQLQTEAFKVWEVLTSYGLVTETFFDLYSHIMTSLTKLRERWLNQHLTEISGSDSTEKGEDKLELDVALTCVVTKYVHLAGSMRQVPGFKKIDEMSESQEDLFMPSLAWGHVSSLCPPVVECLRVMLKDIGESYPTKKHDLSLPTACLNFLASFYTVEGRQSGIDAVSCLEHLETLSTECLIPFLTSYGADVIIQRLVPYSNLLETESTLLPEVCQNLPSLHAYMTPSTDETMAKLTDPNEHRTRMPILKQHTPFGFLTALLRLLLAVCQRHKGLREKLLRPLVESKDILMYGRKICSISKSPLAGSHFTKGETLFQYFWLKACSVVPSGDPSLVHRLSLRLLSMIQHGEEHLAHDLMSLLVFSESLISEGSEPQLTSQALADLSLSDTLHMRSATQEDLSVCLSQLLSQAVKNLATIRGHYLMAFGGMEKAVQESRNQFFLQSHDISSLCVQYTGESLMPKDWMYMPLINVYNQREQQKSTSGPVMSAQAVAMVTSTLQWVYLLEEWRPQELTNVSVTVRLTRIMCAFLAGTDLFLERPVHHYLAALLRTFTSQKSRDRMDFEETVPGITSFYDLYQEFLDQYEGVSFGDPVFGLYLFLPLQQTHSSMLRKAVWGERRSLLRTLRLPLNEMLIPLEAFTSPDETDPELIGLYMSALVSNAVLPTWSPVMYLIAVHHANRFLYLSEADGHANLRDRLWAQILSQEYKHSDVIFYKKPDKNLERGMELYPSLPAHRQTTLDRQRHRLREKTTKLSIK